MELLPGMQAPRIALPLVTGGEVELAAGDQPRLLFFFKVECPASPIAVPAIERLGTQYATRSGFQIVAISQDEVVGTKAWMERHGLTVPVALDHPDFRASSAFGLVAVPTAVLLDGSNGVLAVQEGWSQQGYDDLAREVARLTGRRFAAVAAGSGPPFRPG